jgi:hypothetical protein
MAELHFKVLVCARLNHLAYDIYDVLMGNNYRLDDEEILEDFDFHGILRLADKQITSFCAGRY